MKGEGSNQQSGCCRRIIREGQPSHYGSTGKRQTPQQTKTGTDTTIAGTGAGALFCWLNPPWSNGGWSVDARGMRTA